MSDWYARHFGRGTQQPQTRPTYPQARQDQQQQQVPMQYVGRTVPQQQQPPAGYQPPGTIRVTMDNLWDAMQNWRGGPAHKTDPYPCPNCGSNNFSSRATSIMRGPPPAPHCFDCGFNGLFEQGLQSTWQS